MYRHRTDKPQTLVRLGLCHRHCLKNVTSLLRITHLSDQFISDDHGRLLLIKVLKTCSYKNLHTYKVFTQEEFCDDLSVAENCFVLQGTEGHRITQEAVQPHCEFRFLCPLQGGCTLSSQPRHFDHLLTAQTKLWERGVEKKMELISLECWERLDITHEGQEGAADCTGRGKGVFNLKASVVFKPSASWGVNQHLGYR